MSINQSLDSKIREYIQNWFLYAKKEEPGAKSDMDYWIGKIKQAFIDDGWIKK